VQAPSLIALGAGVGHFFARVVEVEHLDAGLAGGKRAVVLKRTRHFALQTPGAFVGVDVQDFLHGGVSCGWWLFQERMNSHAYE
jgi:hypothetical protein